MGQVYKLNWNGGTSNLSVWLRRVDFGTLIVQLHGSTFFLYGCGQIRVVHVLCTHLLYYLYNVVLSIWLVF